MLDDAYFEAVAEVLNESGFGIMRATRKDTGKEVFVLGLVMGLTSEGGLRLAPVAEFFEQAETNNIYERPEGMLDGGTETLIPDAFYGWDAATPATEAPVDEE